MTLAIQTADLTKRFKRPRGLDSLFSRRSNQETTAVDRITLDVKPGEIFGIVGPNGAGKTTFIKLLCTLLLPSSGGAYVFGNDIVRDAHKVKQLVGLVTGEERSFFWRLTGRHNLQFFADLYRVPRHRVNTRIEELFALLDLTEVADIPFQTYSTGMKQKLAIARGLVSQPKILFMDEPTKGLDPVSTQGLLRLIREKVVGFLGSTIIMTTHILRDVEQLCDRIAIMDRGKVAACGRRQDLQRIGAQYERYRLKVKGLPAGTVPALTHLSGVVNSAQVAHDDGVLEMTIDMHKGTNALSHVLRHILQNGSDIISCTLEEETFEEIFRNIIRGGNAPLSSARDGDSC